jgi:hypothetical protein
MKGCSCIDKAGSCWRDDKLSLKLDARVLETKWGEGRGLQASRVAAEVAAADMTHLHPSTLPRGAGGGRSSRSDTQGDSTTEKLFPKDRLLGPLASPDFAGNHLCREGCRSCSACECSRANALYYDALARRRQGKISAWQFESGRSHGCPRDALAHHQRHAPFPHASLGACCTSLC